MISELTRHRLSEACRRRKPISDATRRKMSESRKKWWQDPTHRKPIRSITRQRQSDAHKRQWQKPGSRKKFSKARKKQWRNPDYRKKFSEAQKRWWQDPKHRKKLSDAHKKVWQNPEYRKKRSASLKAIWTVERRRWWSEMFRTGKFVNGMKGRTLTLETRMKISAKKKGRKMHANTRRQILESLARRPASSLEQHTASALRKLKIHFRSHKIVCPYVLDFFLPDLNIDLECDGSYWHSIPKVKSREAKRDAYIKSLGMRVVRISDKQDILSELKKLKV
jgi:very-short-patch-repair endonuclease